MPRILADGCGAGYAVATMTDTTLRPTDVPSAIRVVRTRADLREALVDVPRPIGLVPTMGWLHAGHRSLMERSRAENPTTVMTLFVNPKQFNSTADLERYPRNEARDLAIAAEEGVDLVFAPSADEVYPPGFETTVSVGRLAGDPRGGRPARPLRRRGDRCLDSLQPGRRRRGLLRPEGRAAGHGHQPDGARPRHSDGRRRLPDRARGGRPGASSRNALLSAEARTAAPIVHRALLAAVRRYEAGERSADVLRDAMWETLTAEPLAEPEYVSVASLDPRRELAELDTVDAPALLSMAVRFGDIRLIDNERLGA